MQILLIKMAMIAVFWSGGMFALNRIFRIILGWKEQIHIKFFRSMSRVTLTVITSIRISGLFNIAKTLSTILLISSSLLVVIVGFATQQTLADVIGGVILNRSRPFNLGEEVNISSLGISGIMEDMTACHIVIRTYHNSRMITPDSVIGKTIVGNSNYNSDYIGNYVGASVSYESNLEQAIGVMQETVTSYPLMVSIHPDPSERNKVNMAVKELRDDGVILKFTVWTRNIDDNFTAYSDIRRLVRKNFNAVGISIPYRYVHVVTGNLDKKLKDNGIVQK